MAALTPWQVTRVELDVFNQQGEATVIVEDNETDLGRVLVMETRMIVSEVENG